MTSDKWDYWTESLHRRQWIRESYGVDVDSVCCAPEPNAGHKCWCDRPKSHDGPHEHLCAERMAWSDGDEQANGSTLPSEDVEPMRMAHGLARKAAEAHKAAKASQ